MNGILTVALACLWALPVNGADTLTLTSTDAAVLTTVLTQFEQSKKSAQYNAQGYIGISPATTALVPSMRDEDYFGMLKARGAGVPDDALHDYIRRNRQTFQLSAFKSLGNSLRIESEDRAFTGMIPNPDLKTYVYLRVPGYSADGTYAYVSFDFCWSMHIASGFYLLKRRGGAWTIVATDFAFAV